MACAIISARWHVYERDLLVMKAPTLLLQHAKLYETDKKIWDQSCLKEFYGLVKVDK